MMNIDELALKIGSIVETLHPLASDSGLGFEKMISIRDAYRTAKEALAEISEAAE